MIEETFKKEETFWFDEGLSQSRERGNEHSASDPFPQRTSACSLN